MGLSGSVVRARSCSLRAVPGRKAAELPRNSLAARLGLPDNHDAVLANRKLGPVCFDVIADTRIGRNVLGAALLDRIEIVEHYVCCAPVPFAATRRQTHHVL